MKYLRSMAAWPLYLLLLLQSIPLLAAELPDFRQVIKEYGPEKAKKMRFLRFLNRSPGSLRKSFSLTTGENI